MDSLTFITKIVEHSAWPISIIILILILKKPIVNILDKLRKANIKGNTFEFEKQAVQSSSKLEATSVNIPIPTDSAGVLQDFEKLIRRDLTTANIQDSGEKENILISHLAATQLNAAYERAASTIFGSQVDLLRSLNSTASPSDISSLKLFYDNAALKYPDYYKNYDFEAYVNYLLNMALINEIDSKYSISRFGIGFLVFITEKGLTGFRHL